MNSVELPVNSHHENRITGLYVNMREAEVSDAEFILGLRTNPLKSRFISKTDSSLARQIEYMQTYKKRPDEWYFIIEDKDGRPIGTNRVYRYPLWHKTWMDPQFPGKGILGPGSWLLIDGLSPFQSMESDLLIKRFFFDDLRMSLHPMCVHKDNLGVIGFHQKWWGAEIIGFDEPTQHHLLNLTRESYLEHLPAFEKFIYRKRK